MDETRRVDTEWEDGEFQLDIVQACRFRALLKQTLDKLQLINSLSLQSARKRQNVKSQGRRDILSLMVRQKSLEGKFASLMTRRGELTGLHNKGRFTENQNHLKEVSGELKDSTRTIFQSLTDHPTASSNLHKVSRDCGWVTQVLEDAVDELKNQSYDKLEESVQLQMERAGELVDLQQRQRHTADALKTLIEQNNVQKAQHEKEISSKRAQINELTSQLKKLCKNTQIALQYEKATALAESQAVTRVRRQKLLDIEAGISEVVKAKGRDDLVHSSTDTFLSGETDSLVQLKEAWEHKYQREVSHIGAHITRLSNKRDETREQLDALSHRWESEQKEKHALMLEKQERRRQYDREAGLRMAMHIAQCKIRFYWRVYCRKRDANRKKARRAARLRRKREAARAKEAKFQQIREESKRRKEEKLKAMQEAGH